MFPGGVNLRNMLDQAWTDDAIRRVDGDGTNILQTVALLASKSPKKAGLPKNVTSADVMSRWDDAVEGLRRAASLLTRVGVWDYGSIPYDALVPALGAILAPSGGLRDDVQTREMLRARVGRWVYATAVGEEYNEGTDVKQLQHYTAGKPWLQQGADETPGFLSGARFWSKETTNGGLGGAKARAFIAALNQVGPPDFMTRDRLGHGVDRTDADRHHIFPRAYLQSSGYQRGEIQRALNMTFLLPETNRFINDRAPSEYISDLIKRRAANDGTEIEAARTAVKKLLERHFIDDASFEALVANDYEAFLAARAVTYRAYLKDEFGVSTVEAPADAEATEAEPDELGEVDDVSDSF
jgi:hypothetical protein